MRWNPRRVYSVGPLGAKTEIPGEMNTWARFRALDVFMLIAVLGFPVPATRFVRAQSQPPLAQIRETLASGRAFAAGASGQRRTIAPQLVQEPGTVYKTVYNKNWGGYAVVGSGFTLVQGSWIVPEVNCTETPNTYSDFWVGFDGGFASGNPKEEEIEQTGTSSDCSGTAPSYSGWYQFPNGPGGKLNRADCYAQGQIHVKDQIHAEVSYNDSTSMFTVTLIDRTQPQLPACTHSWGTGSPVARSSAEWIAEATTLNDSPQPEPLADFGTVDFSGCGSSKLNAADFLM